MLSLIEVLRNKKRVYYKAHLVLGRGSDWTYQGLLRVRVAMRSSSNAFIFNIMTLDEFVARRIRGCQG